MTNQHPITPPPEVVDRLFMIEGSEEDRIIAAYRAGADHELEAGVNYIDNNISGNKAREFRAIRRPKPPSLKEQALEALKALPLPTPAGRVTADRLATIRRALEALDD
jgi:hypothetical protein